MALETSILKSTKKILGIDPTYTAFDQDIIVHINSCLSSLTQIGVGPSEGYSIEDDSDEWTDFFGTDPVMNMCQTYVYLKVRFLFDPPATSFAIDAMKQQLDEFEQRISYQREWMLDPNDPRTVTTTPDPNREYWFEEGVIFDG